MGIDVNQTRLFIRNRVYPEISKESSLMVTSDEKWLSFVISQLMTNAVKFTVGKGKKIIFKGREYENKKVLEVIDQGVGIPKSELRDMYSILNLQVKMAGGSKNLQEWVFIS